MCLPLAIVMAWPRQSMCSFVPNMTMKDGKVTTRETRDRPLSCRLMESVNLDIEE